MRTPPAPTGSVQFAVLKPVPLLPLPILGRCLGMPKDGQQHGSHDLLRQIGADFEALTRLIEQAIEHLAVSGTGDAHIERLVRAKESAEQGAALAKKYSTSNRA